MPESFDITSRDPKKPKAGKLGASKTETPWQKQEQRVADKLGGIVQRGSGNQPGKRGDVQIGDYFLTECKVDTKGKSITILKKWLLKIDREATQAGMLPALVFGFDKMDIGVEKDWAAVPKSVFSEMLNHLEITGFFDSPDDR